MLTQLPAVKARLAIPEIDIQYDALLAVAIEAVSRRFDLECHRTLARTEDFTQEFAAKLVEICAACYPIENVSKFEVKTDEIEGWIDQTPIQYVVRRRCVFSLKRPVGSLLQQARVVYTGGYVLPGAAPGPGQAPLPVELERAAVEQVAYWFQNRDRLGLARLWEYHGTYRQFVDLDLLSSVRAVLFQHTRWEW
jgi:hypothetical protein